MPIDVQAEANVLDALFHDQGIQARVALIRSGPRYVEYVLSLSREARVNQVKLLWREMAVRLGVEKVAVTQSENGAVVVSRPKGGDTQRLVSLTQVLARVTKPNPRTAYLGLDQEGRVLGIQFGTTVPHVLVAGTTGSGKSMVLGDIALSLMLFNRPSQLQLVIIDPKGKLSYLQDAPHFWRSWPVIQEREAMVIALAEVAAEMERRRAGESNPLLLVIIDELGDIAMTNPQAMTYLTRLLQRGREPGVHVVGATQYPSSQIIDGAIKINMTVRIIGQVGTPEEARVASGVGETRAETLQGRGDMILRAGGGLLRFQAAGHTRVEGQQLVRALFRGRTATIPLSKDAYAALLAYGAGVRRGRGVRSVAVSLSVATAARDALAEDAVLTTTTTTPTLPTADVERIYANAIRLDLAAPARPPEKAHQLAFVYETRLLFPSDTAAAGAIYCRGGNPKGKYVQWVRAVKEAMEKAH